MLSFTWESQKSHSIETSGCQNFQSTSSFSQMSFLTFAFTLIPSLNHWLARLIHWDQSTAVLVMFSSLFWYCPPKSETICSDSTCHTIQPLGPFFFYMITGTDHKPWTPHYSPLLHKLTIYYTIRHIKSHAKLKLAKKKKSMQLWKAKFVIAFNSLVMHVGGKEKENKPVFRPASRSNKKSGTLFWK